MVHCKNLCKPLMPQKIDFPTGSAALHCLLKYRTRYILLPTFLWTTAHNSFTFCWTFSSWLMLCLPYYKYRVMLLSRSNSTFLLCFWKLFIFCVFLNKWCKHKAKNKSSHYVLHTDLLFNNEQYQNSCNHPMYKHNLDINQITCAEAFNTLASYSTKLKIIVSFNQKT